MSKDITAIDIGDLFLILLRNIKEDSSIRGRTKIQKIMFILKNEFNLPQNFKHFLYTYGPYSIILQNEIDTLATFDLVNEKAIPVRNYLTYEYSLTEQGQKLADSIIHDLSESTKGNINRMVNRARELQEESLEKVIETAYTYVPTGIP